MNWIFRLCVLVTLFFATTELGAAQTRTMNANTPGLLRTWPAENNWQVILVHAIDNKYKCLDLTGQVSNNDKYIFGFEWSSEQMYIVISDQNSEAASGTKVTLSVDNTMIGSYAVDKRASAEGMSTMRALIPMSEADRLSSLLKVGGNVQIGTDEATYSASLDGMTNSLNEVGACLTEAGALPTGG